MAGGARHGSRERTLESVWDYPVPPSAEASSAHAQVILNGFLIADSTDTVRVLQTGIAPVHYFPPQDVRDVYLRLGHRITHCAFKGKATYYDVVVGTRMVTDAAWTYRNPLPGYEDIADRFAFYPALMDVCLLDDEPVRAVPADRSGGWVTRDVLGLSRGYPPEWDATTDT